MSNMHPLLVTVLTNGFFKERECFIKSWQNYGDIIVYTDDVEDINIPSAEVIRSIKRTDWLGSIFCRPTLLLNTMDKFPGRNMVFIDSDCWVARPFDEVWDRDFDIGITPCYDQPRACGGVIFFRPTERTKDFAQQWINIQDRMIALGFGVKSRNHSASELSMDALAKTTEAKVCWFPETYNIRLNDRWFEKKNIPVGHIYHFAGIAHEPEVRDILFQKIKTALQA